jgi:hypothetical protein
MCVNALAAKMKRHIVTIDHSRPFSKKEMKFCFNDPLLNVCKLTKTGENTVFSFKVKNCERLYVIKNWKKRVNPYKIIKRLKDYMIFPDSAFVFVSTEPKFPEMSIDDYWYLGEVIRIQEKKDQSLSNWFKEAYPTTNLKKTLKVVRRMNKKPSFEDFMAAISKNRYCPYKAAKELEQRLLQEGLLQEGLVQEPKVPEAKESKGDEY